MQTGLQGHCWVEQVVMTRAAAPTHAAPTHAAPTHTGPTQSCRLKPLPLSPSPIHPHPSIAAPSCSALLHPHAQHCCTPMLSNIAAALLLHCCTPMLTCKALPRTPPPGGAAPPAPAALAAAGLGLLVLLSPPLPRRHHSPTRSANFDRAQQLASRSGGTLQRQPSPLAVRAARGERSFRGGSGGDQWLTAPVDSISFPMIRSAAGAVTRSAVEPARDSFHPA